MATVRELLPIKRYSSACLSFFLKVQRLFDKLQKHRLGFKALTVLGLYGCFTRRLTCYRFPERHPQLRIANCALSYYLNAEAELVLGVSVHNVGLTKACVTRCVTADTSLLMVDADSCEVLVPE